MRSATALVIAAAGLVAGCGSVTDSGAEGASAPSASADSGVTTDAPSSSTTAMPAAAPATPAVPVVDDPERITIPGIGVDAPVIDLGLTPEGGLEVPADWDATGWWAGGAPPGHVGPAVIAGHVDSKSGPAVFFRIDELQAGDEITVTGADGTSTTFAVDEVRQFAKDEFPTREIYGPTARPTLRLVTCGGPFNSSWGHYLDNVVVLATAVTA